MNLTALKAYKPLIKPVFIITGLTIGGILAYKFITKGTSFVRTKKEGSEFSKEQTQKLSYPKTQYKSWADSLQEAWYEYPFGLGTVEETVYNIIRKLKNNSDWLELQKAYGVRPYYQGGFKYDDANLVETITYEDEYGEMRKKINQILKSKGITYSI